MRLTGLSIVLSRSGYLATERERPDREALRLVWWEGNFLERFA